MCGITGCLINNGSAMKSVMSALSKLQNRGYDSAGVCANLSVRIDNTNTCDCQDDINDNQLKIVKNVSGNGENAVDKLMSDPIADVKCNIAFGHTRWATHGSKTLENSHPHCDDSGRFAMIHNGIIENYVSLRQELIDSKLGYNFYGQTDTEIAVKYLDLLNRRGKPLSDLNNALTGSWAILVMDRLQTDRIFFMKNGSPLIIGYNEDKTKAMFVSELIGFDEDITSYSVLADGDYGYVKIDNQVKMVSRLPNKLCRLTDCHDETTPAPYPHWTIKEINDQPAAITRLLNDRLKYSTCTNTTKIVFPELENITHILKNQEVYLHIILLACGTSYHAANYGAKFFKEFRTNCTIETIDGADFEETDIIIGPNRVTVLILLSQSGETKDLCRALEIGKSHGLTTIGLINVENSLISREVDYCCYLKAGREHAVASTKSFTNQVVMLLLIAIWMNTDISTDNTIIQNYMTALTGLADDFTKIILQSQQQIVDLIPYFKNKTDCFILGKHSGEWVAREGSLKIREISYIHSEGFSSAALKHGPFALLSDSIPVIFLANDDRFYSKIENVTAEVKSRDAKVIYLTNRNLEDRFLDNIDHLFYYKTDSILFPLISIVPLQFLAYYLALDRGNHPDYPRNLAKVVTVE